jgi:hypothetical protein
LPAPSRARRLPGVPAPSAHADAGAHLPGICLVPVPVRLQGFSPSCRVTSPASFRPFKAGDAHGVLPFEASPSGRSRGASRRPVPSCRYLHSAHMAEATMRPLADPPSGPCSPPESVTIERGLAVQPLAAPLGFPRSRAFLACVAAGFPAAPLSGLRAPGSRQGRSASQGFDPLARCCAPRSEDRWEPQPFCDSRTSFPFRVLRAASSRARAERVPDIAARRVRSKGRP